MSRFNTLARPRAEPEAGGAILGTFWAVLAGLLVPALVLLVGLLAALLNSSSGLSQQQVQLGTYLSVWLPKSFSDQDLPLFQLTQLVALTFGVACLFCMSVWLNRRASDARARRIVKALHLRVLRQSLRRAELEGAAAQHLRAQQIIGHQLPLVQEGLSLWYRAIPRSVLTLIGCVALSLSVDVWLTLLAVVSCVLLWQLFRRLRDDDQSDLADWEVPRARHRMAELVGQAPLLARLQTQGLADRAFGSELDTLYRTIGGEDARRGRVLPTVFLAAALAIAVMMLGLGVNLFSGDSGLSLPAALILSLALLGAVVSAGRLASLASQLASSSDAGDSVYHYLRPSDEIAPSEQRVGLAGLRQGVEIHDVTLGETADPILRHLSLKLTPGSLVALLGTEPVSTRALAELLMGFGRPTEGRVAIDGIPLLDVHPQALSRNVMWIEPAGPIWDGTIQENLRGNDESIDNSTLVEALEQVDVYERLQRLPDGLNTLVAAHDSMLGVETTYAVAVARAILHKPPIVLAMEPPPPAEHLADDPCLKALQKLVEAGTLVVMLPRRLQTLRTADRVVLLNGPRLVGEGKHAQLLADSDLYRHLNYLLFNPYRHQRADV